MQIRFPGARNDLLDLLSFGQRKIPRELHRFLLLSDRIFEDPIVSQRGVNGDAVARVTVKHLSDERFG